VRSDGWLRQFRVKQTATDNTYKGRTRKDQQPESSGKW
jgi:hypothetical protein